MQKLTTKQVVLTLLVICFTNINISAQDKSDWMGGVPEGCTSITVGKNASVDGSVITSHTDDSHRTRSWMNIVPALTHSKNSNSILYKREACDSLAMPTYKHVIIGDIPQVSSTYSYLNTAYPCMNEKQLAIGESTFMGRFELQSDAGLIDCPRLCKLMLERCANAREAIKMADELTKKYGWNDFGECLTIADKNEVWHFEIIGPGKDKVGAVWVAQRVPDNHISVSANASRISEINIKDTNNFKASENIYDVAKLNGWWNENELFSFCSSYDPEGRKSIAARRREWRVLDLLAPSLKLDANDREYPFSVEPDSKVKLMDLVNVFKDYYEGTPYDMTKDIITFNKKGEKIISPLANPFLPYDQLKIQNIPGSWYYTDHETGDISFLGERTIARWYTMYGTIIQCRDWLPDEVGGVVWLAQDNIATSVYIPVYAGSTDLPTSYKIPGRVNGYTRESAWWAFNRLSTLTAQRWGEARYDVDSVFIPMQTELFANQAAFEKEILKEKNLELRKEKLTEYTIKYGEEAVNKAWRLGDYFWTKYDEKF